MDQSKARILIVEDEAIIARDIERQLVRAGYGVIAAVPSGEAAFEQIERSSSGAPELVLMDIRLRGAIDGIEAARVIRERYKLPVIYLTAHADEDTLTRAKMTEPFGYIVKPIGHANLTGSIETALYKHRMERRLEEQRALFNTILQTVPEAVIVADSSGKVQFMNPAAEQLTGWTPAGFAGQPLRSIVRLHNGGSPETLDELVATAFGSDAVVRIPRQTRLERRDGSFVNLDGHITVSRRSGEAAGVLLSLQNSSDRQREEQQIRQEQTMAAVGQLARDVANDFYSLFDLVADCASELMLGVEHGSDLYGSASIIYRAAETATVMTRQLLDLTGPNSERPESVDLNGVLERSLSFFQRLCGRAISIELRLCSEPATVFAHTSQLDQLALNLVLHARDQALGTGTLLLATEVAKGQVHLTAQLDQIDGFAAIPSTRSWPLEKPALNLTVVKAIVKSAEGNISVSEEQEGRFSIEIRLPFFASPREPAGGTVAGPKATVLTVGLELELALLLHPRLEESGFFVLESANAQEAILVSDLYRDAVDLVIVDDTKIAPRAQQQVREVISSRHPETSFLCLCSQRGAGPVHGFDLLWKPFEPAEVVAHARALVKTKRAAAEARGAGA